MSVKYDKKCPLCKNLCKDVNEHLLQVHNIKLEEETKTFKSVSDFMTWKEGLQKETKSLYIKRNGSKKAKNGNCVSFYFCHRSGSFNSRGKNLRRLKIMGSHKIGGECPARMRVQVINNGRVRVNFISTHVGHICDVNRIPLSKTEKDSIANDIAKKIPLECILNKVNTLEGNPDRIHLTTKKDLHNIIAEYKLDSEKCDDKDAVSVDKWVMDMNKSNVVKLYKPQGTVNDEFPQLKSDDFCLILSNCTQQDFLKRFGNNVICIDSTHGINSYNFHMYTITVLDETKACMPCTFMFSNRSDVLVMELFFKTVFSPVECAVTPRFLMSDTENTFIDAWHNVFPNSEIKHLYSSWHVDEAWRDNLCKIKAGNDKKVEVYKTMKNIMFERDENSFHMMLNNLLQQLYNDPRTTKFAKYFEKYAHEPSKWAHCYRLNEGVNTNMILESFHRNIKHIYSREKKYKRLVKTIQALYRYVNTMCYATIIGFYKGNMTKKLACLRKRHQIAVELSLESVYRVFDNEWIVFSSNGMEMHSVSKISKECDCNLRCQYCAACIHAFSCTCTDSSVLWNMCKHIHLVCRKIEDKSLHDEAGIREDESYDVEILEQASCKIEIPEDGSCEIVILEVESCEMEIAEEVSCETGIPETSCKTRIPATSIESEIPGTSCGTGINKTSSPSKLSCEMSTTSQKECINFNNLSTTKVASLEEAKVKAKEIVLDLIDDIRSFSELRAFLKHQSKYKFNKT